MKTYGVKFKENGKTYNFIFDQEINIGEKVIVETEKGDQLVIVESIIEKDIVDNNKKIKRVATEEDYNTFLKNIEISKKILKEARELAKKSKLNLTIIDANYSLNKDFLVFNFIADDRIDFRELVKELANNYHTRIELHQIGARDKAKLIGGIGLCGRSLCCNNHMKTVNSVNINMVKNQNIALNPTKINGACGRLLCCFNFENSLYEENRKKLPKYNQKVTYNKKEGIVISQDVLNLKYKIQFNDGTTEEVSINE